MALSVTTRKCDPEVTVIDLTGGRITLGKESGQIEAAILKALSEGAARLVVNLAEVTYVDSTGIGIIAYCFGKVSAGECARDCSQGASGLVLEVFQLTRLDSVMAQFFPRCAGGLRELSAAASV